MHTFVHALAIYASISTIISAIIFATYLELYSWLTNYTLTSADPFTWRTMVPHYAMWIMVLSGIIGSCATVASMFIN